ncbi:trace amine-associated receptor 4-like [Hoplias malabaricus]|uniref:trace amine-associated receptor 4-like n=1 Tax=Hoplias malabaricus TaxID=27720 RepID=UPI0034629FF9
MNKTDVENVLLCFPHWLESCPRMHRFFAIRVSIYIFMLVAILMTVFGNMLVMISISHFRQLHSPTNLIILSLAVVDCLLGCLVMPFSMVRWVEGCWFLGDIFCQIHSGLDMTLSIASILHHCLVSIDRYMAICEPLSYKLKVTNGTVSVWIAMAWMFSFMFSFGIVLSKVNISGLDENMQNSCMGNCALFFNKEWGVIAPLINFYIPGTIMSCLYLKIFHVARKQARIISNSVDRVISGDKKQMSDQRERKAAKTLGIVMGVFLLCWLPFFLATVIYPFLDFSTPINIFDALVWFGYFNSMFNSLIYGFFYPNFQKAFRIIIYRYICCFKKSQST